MQPVLRTRGLKKSYHDGRLSTDVLRGIDLEVLPGEKLAIIGSSGSGKSTLLHLLGGLDAPTSGTVEVLGQDMSSIGEKARGKLRNRALGFVYQFHHLLPEFSALENIMMPLMIRGTHPAKVEQRAHMLLERIGMSDRGRHRPAELSGGERQRVAIARAVINEPRAVLADEPTGNLDQHNAEQVLALLMRMNRELKTALVIVTHDFELSKQMDRVLRMRDGKLYPIR